MATVKFTIELTVEHSQIDTFKKLAREMNAIVRYNEPETIQCQWFFHEGDDKWYLTEMFANSDAFLKHLQDTGPKLEEILEIADDGSNDLMTITKGDLSYEAENKEVTNRSRLRVDARKWIASKLKPKKYGDKVDMAHSGVLTLNQITGMEIVSTPPKNEDKV